ncbi:hypothetical protein PRIPAC_96262 [Pristionchus pacificus]|uniref:Uncharacterized protein n=1 Tax=Pristionchus pacificus TaxID=54126 RepID=A0A2A6D322_PRIPA|nr:hypothetical protein PRIPAC_96262 [Pristionchus pacificus]|eukprot:PDM84683.1 hypothetical protein PRIPAC_33706 [Pristionchus pacificus]
MLMLHMMHQQSYDAWKAKCALEKVAREALILENPMSRKRIYSFDGETGSRHISNPSSSSRDAYVTLPTIPPVRVLVDMEMSTVVVPEKKRFLPESRANPASSMPISTCPSRYQFPPHTAATFLPLLAPSFTQQYTNQKCASIASTITPHSLPRQVLHSEYVLSPEILTAIRAIPTSLLLATLEKGQSVFRRASPVPSFTLVPERLSEIGAPPYDPCTELRNILTTAKQQRKNVSKM